MKQTKSNELQWDVLTCLVLSVNMKLQWKELRDNLHKKTSNMIKRVLKFYLAGRLIVFKK